MVSKIKENKFLRYALLIISAFFIAGASVNDGMTGYFWGLPFVALIYVLLDLPKTRKIILCVGIVVIMVVISGHLSSSSLVYPIIGDKITVTKDLPTRTYSDGLFGGGPQFDVFHDVQVNVSFNSSIGTVLAGTVFTINSVIAFGGIDSTETHMLVLVSDNQKLIVDSSYLYDGSKLKLSQFCDYVQWEICTKTSAAVGFDPMRKPFRWLASLMYYAVLFFVVPILLNQF